ncbi:MAG: glycosyltransferase family 2 protein [Elusimicrobia bacterium]|nr:glycosyltransferase family 2 protein [Elusimicrobiota bacterium]
MKRTLVILARNEIEALPKIFDRIPLSAADETIAVDGQSTDGTADFLRSKGVKVLVQEKRGRGEAFILAGEAAQGSQIVFFSPDGNEDPEDIAKLFAELDKGADIAIASRMMAGAFNEEDVHWWRPRKWANQGFTLIANLLWNRGSYVTDTINGFRGLKRSVLKDLKPDAQGYVIEYQLSIRAMKHGLKIVEIPTHEGQRLGGSSGAPAIKTGLIFLRGLWREIVLGS